MKMSNDNKKITLINKLHVRKTSLFKTLLNILYLHFNFLHIFTAQYCCKVQLSDVYICMKKSGRFKINTITWSTQVHDFILIMFQRLISGCSKCSSFVVIHVSSGVDDICTVLSNQPVTFFYWKDSHNAHPQQLQCTSLQRCARSVAQAPKLHPHYNES